MNQATDTVQAEVFAGHDVPRDLVQVGALLLSVEESHADFVRRRYAQRPAPEEADRAAQARFSNAAATGGYGYAVDAAGIAVVSISGLITPESWAWFDGSETISDWVIRDLASMAANADVRGVLFAVNSPGGYVAGSYELSDAVAAITAAKPSAAFINGYGASAAYLQASQTGRITAFRSALVGSIGTRSAVVDAHAYFERLGVRMIPIDSGGMKSAGLIGTEITDAQKEYFTALVNKQQAFFTQAVATGRRMPMEQAQKLADGRIHVAGDALSLGLIDAVGTMDDAYQALLAKVQGGRTTPSKTSPAARQQINDAGGCSAGEVPSAQAPVAGAESETVSMSNPTQTQAPAGTTAAAEPPKAAGMADLIAGCPGASSDFLVEQAKNGATLQQAKDAYLAFQNAQIRARDEELTKLKASATEPKPAEGAKAEEPAARKPGVKPVESKPAEAKAAGGTGDAKGDFESRVAALVKDGKTRANAVGQVAREDPALHAAYIAQANKK